MTRTRIAFIDLETTDLKGNFGKLLCSCTLDYHSGQITTHLWRPGFIGRRLTDDRKVAVATRDLWERFDVWGAWNGKMFDLPFLNTRLQRWGERILHKQKHIDLMYYARRPFLTLHSSRLDAVAKFLQSPNQKTPLDPETWILADAGDRQALSRVREHCEADVRVLRDVYNRLKPHIQIIHR